MLLALAACSGARSTDSDQGALIGGQVASADELGGTVAVAPIPRHGLPTASTSSVDAGSARSSDAAIDGAVDAGATSSGAPVLPGTCTAVRVGPSQLLLAAHCVVNSATVDPIWNPGDSLAIVRDPSGGWKTATVTAVHVHPAWLERCRRSLCAASAVTATIDAPDLAVLDLSAAALAELQIVPISGQTLDTGQAVTVTGYGCTESVTGPDERTSISLRWRETTIVPFATAVHAGSPVASVDVPAAGIYALTRGPASDPNMAGLCPGDSGGPLYRRIDSALYVVGVNANYTFIAGGPASGLPVTNWHTRLDHGSRHDTATWLKSLSLDVH